MKRLLIGTLCVAAGLSSSAKSLVLKDKDVSRLFPAAEVGRVAFSGTDELTLLGKKYVLSEGMEISVSDEEMAVRSVVVKYSGGKAEVMISGDVSSYIEAEVDGAHVRILQADALADELGAEVEYIISGSSENGSLTLEGNYKSTLTLAGIELTNPSGAAVNIQNGKRIAVRVQDETSNLLRDGDGDQKGCLVCKGHLEFKGNGVLSVYGNAAHAIQAKEYVEIKNCSIKVMSAVKDGINCNQYFLLESGEVAISGVGDDAIQCSFKDDADRELEDTGSIFIDGGTIVASTDAKASKCLKADGNVFVRGGDLTLNVSGGGIWDSEKGKTKAAACIGADGEVIISDGSLKLMASGGGGKGINCDGEVTFMGGKTDITTSGGVFAYVNGSVNDNYTGNTDRLNSNYKSSPKGVKADGIVTISAGELSVRTLGRGGEGVESKSTLDITGGDVYVKAYDDAINASSHLTVSGGEVTAISTNNDGLDANGNLYIKGGVIRAFGAGSPECGIDANEEEGYTVFFTGGTLLAVGGSNSVPSKDDSTQPYVSGSGSVAAGSTVSLRLGDEVLATFTVPDEYSSSSSSGGGWGWGPGGGGRGSSILISSPNMEDGTTYTLVNGSSESSVTSRLKGSGGGWRPW